MSGRTKAYVAAVVTVGAAAFLAALARSDGWVADHLMAFLLVAAGTLIAEALVINFAFDRESWSFSVVEVAITFGLLSIPTPPLVIAATLGLAGAQWLLRRPAVKAVFNVAMYAIATAAAGTVFDSLRAIGVGGNRTWMAAILAMGVFYSINQVLLGIVVSLANRQRLSSVLRIGAPMLLAMSTGTVALGILAKHLSEDDPLALVMFVIPVALSYLAYRAWIGSKTESEKMRHLYEAGAALLTNLGSDTSISPFLTKTTAMFRARGAQVATFEGAGGLRIVDNEGVVTHIALDPGVTDAASAIESYLSAQPWESKMAVPLASEIGVTGALIVHGHFGPREGERFTKNDSKLLQLLANEVSIAVSNAALFDSVSEERRKLSDIVEHTSDGIYQVSPDRRIMTWNPAMEIITGFSAAEAVGQMCFNLLRARDGKGVDMCSGDCPIIAAGAHACHQSREAQIMTKEGIVRWISYSHSPIIDSDGKMTSDVIVVRDVTKQREAQELQDDFIATVSHELRTPITPIKGFLMTLLRPEIDIPKDEQRRYFAMMLRQAERLERLVEDVLDASRLESGKLTIKMGVVDASKLCEQIVEGYRASDPAREIRTSIPDGPALAKGNAARLEQVICNLVQNAIRYAPPDRPIELIVRDLGASVTISVRDRGPGIPYDEQESVFERFYRSGHHLTREQGGTGLGLFICRKLVEGMNGRITLSSKYGQGSTFTVALGHTNVADHKLLPIQI